MHKTDVSIRAAKVCRVALLALLVALSAAAPGAAQTPVVADPNWVEFTPSTDHSATLSGVPVVSGYVLRLYQVGVVQPFHQVDLGKPAPSADGQILVDLSGAISSWPMPGGTYQARVAAVGPGGEGVSGPSNEFTVSSCSYALVGTGALFPSAGGGGAVGISTQAGCAWTAAPSASWISMATASGTGSGSAIFSVAANTTNAARSATVLVGTLAYRVDQEGPCAYSISPASQAFAASGGTGTVGVTTGTGCSWSASSSASWITVSAGSGTGNGTMSYQVAANSGDARTGTVTVAGRAHSVSQQAGAAAPPPPPPSNVPPPWQAQDVGSVGLPGSSNYSGGVFTIAAAGTGVSGTQDAFHFVSQPLGAATTITARVTGIGSGAATAAGVMLRDGLTANATQLSLALLPGGAVEFVQRTSTGGATAVRGSSAQALPAWLRLVKNGPKVTAYVSADGTTWRTVGTRNLNSKTLQAGLVASSGNPAELATVTVDNVAIK